MKRIHNIYEPIFCIRRDWLNGHELFFHLVNSLIRIKIARIAIIKIPINKLIQMGDNTHHQDQLITLHNLRPINRIVRAPVKLMPEDEELELIVLIVISLIVFEKNNLKCSQRICQEHQNTTGHHLVTKTFCPESIRELT